MTDVNLGERFGIPLTSLSISLTSLPIPFTSLPIQLTSLLIPLTSLPIPLTSLLIPLTSLLIPLTSLLIPLTSLPIPLTSLSPPHFCACPNRDLDFQHLMSCPSLGLWLFVLYIVKHHCLNFLFLRSLVLEVISVKDSEKWDII